MWTASGNVYASKKNSFDQLQRLCELITFSTRTVRSSNTKTVTHRGMTSAVVVY